MVPEDRRNAGNKEQRKQQQVSENPEGRCSLSELGELDEEEGMWGTGLISPGTRTRGLGCHQIVAVQRGQQYVQQMAGALTQSLVILSLLLFSSMRACVGVCTTGHCIHYFLRQSLRPLTPSSSPPLRKGAIILSIH